MILRNSCESFFIENFQREYYSNTELVCRFNPRWIQEKEVTIELLNKESLEQVIYEISLKAEEPESFGNFELIGSSLFNEEVSIPIDVQSIFSNSDGVRNSM